MKLTGKAKEEFEQWYGKEYISPTKTSYDWFESLHPSMQWGVYQDWADSMGYSIGLSFSRQDSVLNGYENFHSPFIRMYNDTGVMARDLFTYQLFRTRQEARDAAIEKLNEIINER